MSQPFEIADQWVNEVAASWPQTATLLGASGHDDRWDDWSPYNQASIRDARARCRNVMSQHLDHPDRWQRHAARVLVDRLDEELAAYDRGDRFFWLRHIYSAVDEVRDVFDFMDTATEDGWANIAARLETVGDCLNNWKANFEEGRVRGMVGSRRQAESAAEQLRHLAGPQSKWLELARQANGGASDSLAKRVATAVNSAREEVGTFADYVEQVYLPDAAESDGVGRERYVESADELVGLRIDPIETYQWGWEEVNRLQVAMEEVAARIDPHRSLSEVIEMLETDPRYAAASQDEFVDYIQHRQDLALSQLDGPHFDVPTEIRTVTVNLVPPGAALGAYYRAPTEDFGRSGAIWYSFGEKKQIPLWGEVSTAYHEGFPGHHLQIGTAMTLRQNLSRAHRLLIWYSGYGEGWALYTERLMDELGYFEEPQYLLGMLSSQQLRACRVVIDIGCHLGLDIPKTASVGSGHTWSYDIGVETLHKVAAVPLDVAESELKRYLGWPGQAISYKVGERAILAMRDQARSRPGFNLKEFHRGLLGWGEVRLDYLSQLAL